MNDVGAAAAHPWVPGVLSRDPFLIIAGGYRCGTTSLFAYLADHPEINPCTIKEPGFFFSLRLAETPPAYPRGHEAQAYLSMFRKRAGRVRMEATSNYLHDPGCARRLRAALPAARVIVLLREPVSRLVSWYRFLLLQGWLDPATGFEQWIEAQLADPRPTEQRPYPERAVAHGYYAEALSEFHDVFGREAVHAVWFDALKRDPASVMRGIYRFAGLDEDHYAGRTFRSQNEAMKIGRPRLFAAYRALHRPLFAAFAASPLLQFRAREWFYGRLEPRLLGLFTAPADPVVVSPVLERRLRQLYRSDLAPLRALLGEDAPWRAAYEAA